MDANNRPIVCLTARECVQHTDSHTATANHGAIPGPADGRARSFCERKSHPVGRRYTDYKPARFALPDRG